MKLKYIKPMVSVEHYALTQSIASCSGIKIKKTGPNNGPLDVLADPDATNIMKNMARKGGFLSWDGCTLPMETSVDADGSCYHTNTNAAFNS